MTAAKSPSIVAKVLQAAAGVCRKPGKAVPRQATHVHVRRAAPYGQPPTKNIHTVVEATDGRAVIRLELPTLLKRSFLIPAGHVKRLEIGETAEFEIEAGAAAMMKPFRVYGLPMPGKKGEQDFEPEDLEALRVVPGTYEPAFTVTVAELATIASAFQRAGVKKVTVELPPEAGLPISFRGAERGAQGALVEAVLLPESLFPEEQEGDGEGAGDAPGQQTLDGMGPGDDFGPDMDGAA